MYDNIEKNINLSSDEIDLLSDILNVRLETCISIGEELTVKSLLDKLNY